MRQRMLSLPPHPPHAYDLAESDTSTTTHPSITDTDRRDSQHAFVSWLSRPPVELGISAVDVDATARSLFARRLTAMRTAQEGEMDPIDVRGYGMWCCEAWHAGKRVLVKLPERGEEERLYMVVIVGEAGEMRLDNLFSTQRDVVAEKGMHRWTADCAPANESAVAKEQGEEEDQGAEYINDADDFWAGFSDDDDAGGKAKVQAGASVAVDSRVEGDVTEQEKAIKDIVRGAYTLHRSIRSPGTDSVEEFIQLVRSAITTA
ncbi:uncharacterized protein SRS1_15418 [Sporisorium reilianum f. sp. reilianum]|uniref:Uncharacterized protein n=1 Tax=Sporisorium reilianum f. sp. reilianum TaxID=72559 RepID=A0A2N8UIC8_9BASI|nr:uncharacterized protein SRS1_15418 [Sporisorium reilianum f. sp. reilianum]